MKRVLVVDDALFMRDALTSILERNGYEVVGHAQDGKEAITKYKSLYPDVVTLDVNMPGMNGVEVLKALKILDPAVKVVMVTANGQDSVVRDAVTLGAKNFIVKPFTERRLIEVMKRL